MGPCGLSINLTKRPAVVGGLSLIDIPEDFFFLRLLGWSVAFMEGHFVPLAYF